MSENIDLRRLLWLNHGCPISGLYGDDGEMQCGNCLIDFKRHTAQQIERMLMIKKYPEQIKTIDALMGIGEAQNKLK